MATAYIKEMINATTSDIVYPVTKSQAVYMEDNSTTVQKAIDDLSALKNVPALDSQTTPNVSDLLTIFRNTNSTGYKALVSDVAKTIIESYQSSSLAGKTQSVKAALDSLNSSIIAPENDMNWGDVRYRYKHYTISSWTTLLLARKETDKINIFVPFVNDNGNKTLSSNSFRIEYTDMKGNKYFATADTPISISGSFSGVIIAMPIQAGMSVLETQMLTCAFNTSVTINISRS